MSLPLRRDFVAKRELTRRCGDSYGLNQIKFKMHVYVFVVLAV